MSDTKIIKSSGNVFEDLGFENPAEWKAKSTLAMNIRNIIKEKGLSQSEVAEKTGVNQPDISRLINGKFEKFSIEKMIRVMDHLDCEILIEFKMKPSVTIKRKHSKQKREKIPA